MTEIASAPTVLSTASGLERVRRELLYLAGGLLLCVPAFAVAVAGFAAGVGTVVVWVGLPILVLTLRACRGFAAVERRSSEWVTGRELPPHHYRTPRGAWGCRGC
jgi:hypothetical protein